MPSASVEESISSLQLTKSAPWQAGRRSQVTAVLGRPIGDGVAMGDEHSRMLALAIRLAERAAAGESLSLVERAIADIMWIDTLVSPNGFDGWLAYTSCERMRRTMQALAEIGCGDVLDVVEEALEIVGVDPHRMTDQERERRMDSLTDAERARLGNADSRFYDVFGPSMGMCERYARQKGVL